MSSGYGSITNSLAGLAATAFTWSSAYTTGRSRMNDTVMDEQAEGSSTPQSSGQTLVLDLGGSTPVSAIALLNHNLADGGVTVLVESDDNSGFSSPTTRKAATTINTSAPYDKDAVLQFTQAFDRYWRLTFTHSGTKTLKLGELLFMASVTTLTRQTIYGAGSSEQYFLNRNQGQVGHVRSTFLGGPVRTKQLPFKDLRGTTELDELLNMWRATLGGNKNLLFIDNIDSSTSAGSAASQQCLWGKLQPGLSYTQPDFDLYDIDGLTLVGQGREVGA